MPSKFINKSAQKSSNFSSKASYARSLLIICLSLIVLTSCAPTTYRSRYAQPVAQATPAAAKPPIGPPKVVTIVIDPGHGGKDEGAHSTKPRYQEKQLTLMTSLMLKKYLQGMGFRTIITRADDTFIPLKARSCFANSNETDLFVSVHYNAAKATAAEGIEVFYYKSEEDPARSAESKHLGELVLGKIITQTQAKSRGVKHGNLAVVRDTKIPAILVEGGFLTNENERTRLLNPDYVKRLAWGIAIGVRDYVQQRQMPNL